MRPIVDKGRDWQHEGLRTQDYMSSLVRGVLIGGTLGASSAKLVFHSEWLQFSKSYEVATNNETAHKRMQ